MAAVLRSASLAQLDKRIGDHRRRQELEPPPIPPGTPGGDARQLRGIPAIGRGVAGAIAGSAPHRDLH